MGILTRHAYMSLLAAVSVAALVSVGSGHSFAAPEDEATAKSAPDKASEAAKRAFEAGLKSYKAGKHQPAIDSLSAALRGGGLNSSDMARALYIRGLAYKKLSKPGLAISDLTSALWLKNGLNDTDRKSATAERAEAYKMAGLGNGDSGADRVDVADPNVPPPPIPSAQTAAAETAPAPAAAAPQPAVPAVPQPVAAAPVTQPAPAAIGMATPARQESGVPQPLSMFGDTPPPPPVPTARVVAATPGGSTIDQVDALSGTGTGAANPSVAVVAPAPTATQAPAPATTPAAPAGKSTIASFFTDLFSSSSSTATQETVVAPTTTASTTSPATSPASWGNTVPGASNEKPPVVAAAAPVAPAPAKQVAAVVPPPPVPVAASKPEPAPVVKGGKYKAHIAAFRSRAQADALADALAKQHGAALQSRLPTVDEAVIGSMGKFYRVRIGSYATADEPRGLCNTLRNSGYDCLVVSN